MPIKKTPRQIQAYCNKRWVYPYVDYVLSFYGEGGTNDCGATKNEVIQAIAFYVLGGNELRPKLRCDSFEREALKSIILELRK